MYQNKVKWTPTTDYFTYTFSTRREAEAFSRAIEEMNKARQWHEDKISHQGIVPIFNVLLTLFSTLMVGVWSAIWWYLGMKLYPDAVMSCSFWLIGLGSAFGYVVAIILAQFLDTDI